MAALHKLVVLFERFFSGKFINEGNVVSNPLMTGMYRVAYPFACALNLIGLSPNQITTASLVAAVFGFFALIFDLGIGWYWLCWGMAVLLDFCDGTVARMTNCISRTAFRYDHMSDIFKLSLIVLGVGIHLDNKTVWILCCAFIFFFTYFEIVAHDLKNVLLRNRTTNPAPVSESGAQSNESARSGSSARKWINKFPGMKSLLRAGYVMVASFNGHTLLVFFLLPVGGDVTILTLAYLIALCVVGSVTCIHSLLRLQR